MPEDPTIEAEEKPRTLREMLLYKMDRTLAVGGLIALGIVSLVMSGVADAKDVVIAVVGVLGGYMGGRSGR